MSAITNQDLRRAGLKVTLPRLKILELLEKSEMHHMSAEDIYKALIEQGEDVGLATVYRVLTQFEQAGGTTTVRKPNLGKDQRQAHQRHGNKPQ